MSDLGWETVLASQQLKDLEATPLDDPRPRHFVISSSRTASHPTQIRDQENLALTSHNPDQINQDECRLSRLREMQFWHGPCQQFCFLFVWRFLNQQVSIQKYACCLTICKWYSRIYLRSLVCPTVTTKLFLPHSRIKASPHHMFDAATIDVKIHFWFRR